MMFAKCEKKGHKFRARYDEKPNELLIVKGFHANGRNFRQYLYYKIYVYDICVRCGEIKRREE